MSTLDALLMVNHAIRYIITRKRFYEDKSREDALWILLEAQQELEHDLLYFTPSSNWYLTKKEIV